MAAVQENVSLEIMALIFEDTADPLINSITLFFQCKGKHIFKCSAAKSTLRERKLEAKYLGSQRGL